MARPPPALTRCHRGNRRGARRCRRQRRRRPQEPHRRRRLRAARRRHGYKLFSTGSTFNGWHVVGAAGNVAPISGAFVQNGIHFPAAAGKQWLDLTGLSNSATGVAQTVKTKAGRAYRLSFAVENVVDSGGTFGSSSTVVVLVNGKKVLSATNRGGGTTQAWKRFTAAVKATRASTTIEFLNGDPSTESSNGLDDVSLVARP